MKTRNLQIDLMVPLQEHKDTVFNESILKLDSFINIGVQSFVDYMPEELTVGEKHIILQGEDANKICYKPLNSKPICLHTPMEGTVVYVMSEACFYAFDGLKWITAGLLQPTPVSTIATPIDATARVLPLPLTAPAPTLVQNFIGVGGESVLHAELNIQYLYINADVEITATNIELPEVTVIIKQAYDAIHNITWSTNILWENKVAHNISRTKNAMDIVKLFKLPETDHYLGKIIAQNLTY